MQVPHRRGHLLHDGPGLALREELLAKDLVQEFPPAHEVEHQVDMLLRLEDVPETDDVGVLAVAEQNLDLFGAVPLALGDNLEKKKKAANNIRFKKCVPRAQTFPGKKTLA